jgi:mannose-6-phosphate isomerase-like protein (cupin superfamily)
MPVLSIAPPAGSSRSRFRPLDCTCSFAFHHWQAQENSASSKRSMPRGKGPPLHHHQEAEIFRVIGGRYLHQMDGQRFHATPGDVVSTPGGAVHAFVNVTDKTCRQYIPITPGLDAATFFEGLAATMRDGIPDRTLLNAFDVAWNVEFLEPPLSSDDPPVDQEAVSQ